LATIFSPFAVELDPHLSDEGGVFLRLFAQLEDPPFASLVAGLACLDPTGEPLLLFFEQADEVVVLALHGGQAALFLFEEASVAPFVADKFEVLHLDDAGGDGVDEIAVVADKEQGEFLFEQDLFEELHHVDIEVVGGLIEHQDIGFFEDQGRQSHPPLFAS